ncbi:hypothetical protein [Chitinilyticum aquatile]|uniref:hypothetical protein n=1 Tax=Chitinilyticum aquatile TaxID=362520 RepID=UPI0003FC1E32|nr:hypothetical protein [Chitinilyticum aquatile]
MLLRFLPLLLPVIAPLQAATFCLYPLPPAEGKPSRMLNLTVVQFVELADRELKISFGGGNLGSGHEVLIPLKNRAEGQRMLDEMAAQSRQCDKG